MSAVAAVKLSVVFVAPPTDANVTPSGLFSHCTSGAGLPDAADVKLALPPAATVRSSGCNVIPGA